MWGVAARDEGRVQTAVAAQVIYILALLHKRTQFSQTHSPPNKIITHLIPPLHSLTSDESPPSSPMFLSGYINKMSQQMQKVFKAPINTSISKSIYSFPKSSRFDKTTESTCKRPFYNLQRGLRDARATSFGFGDKSSILNNQPGPPPGSYDPDSVFTRNIEKRRGFSFGHHKRVTFDTANEFENPGPGKYDRVMGNDSKISFSIRSKYEDPMLRHASTVGPGQYEAPKMLNSTGNYFNSRFKNSGCGKIGNAARFEDERTLPPGPGKYRDRLGMNRTGTYFNTRVQSNFVMTFQGTVRPPINAHNDVPGPGSYYVFNSFQGKPLP